MATGKNSTSDEVEKEMKKIGQRRMVSFSRELLEKEGLPQHALVCDRHTGVGITIEDIRAQELPIPERDMTPTGPRV